MLRHCQYAVSGIFTIIARICVRCESIFLRSHWVMLVMDVFSRRIVGFGVESANIDGVSACRMFNRAIAGQRLPRHVSCAAKRHALGHVHSAYTGVVGDKPDQTGMAHASP